ncbi:MAG TPA: DNA ligase D, partial [Planctomycetota bacterium]|nr:DNA ligase D [Planctomycetota bacterium]
LIKKDAPSEVAPETPPPSTRARETRNRSRRTSPSKKTSGRRPAFVTPELATLADAAPSGPGWVHEAKLDGYRLELLVDGGTARVFTRSGADWTARFPTIAKAALELPGQSLLLDGEVVALGKDRLSSFHALQNALDVESTAKLEYHAFDLLHFDGRDLREHPLSVRRAALEELLAGKKRGGVIRLAERLRSGDPLAAACARGLEGVVSKRDDAPYESRRSRSWIKSKCGRRQEFVIVGFTEPSGSRGGLGSLLLAVMEGEDGLRYAGKVGTGFSDASLRSLRAKLDRLERARTPLAQPPTERPSGVLHWVRPKLVAEVSFTEWTPEGLLRHPVFVDLREDKPVASIRREEPALAASADASPYVAGVKITHPDRIVYPESGITKLELATYYELVAPYLLPHLAERPLSTVRCPGGQGGTCFYQKHWSSTSPGVETMDVREEKGATKAYAIVHDVRGLITLVQYGVMEFHPWGSRGDDVEAPDRITFDLDPHPGMPWKRVVDGAFALRDLLARLGFESWLKTSGGKGLHVVLPIERRLTWSAVSAFARAVSERVEREHPERYVTVLSKAARQGRIFIDHLRNSRGATAIAPWSTRARASASISVPIEWDQALAAKSGDAYTLRSVARLLDSKYVDPWADLRRARNRVSLDAGRKLLAGE